MRARRRVHRCTRASSRPRTRRIANRIVVVVVVVPSSSSSSPVPRASSASPRRRDANGRCSPHPSRPGRGPPPRPPRRRRARRRRRGLFEPLDGTRAGAGATTRWTRAHARTTTTTTTTTTRARARTHRARIPPLARQQTNGDVARGAREVMTRESRGITRGGWSYLH